MWNVKTCITCPSVRLFTWWSDRHALEWRRTSLVHVCRLYRWQYSIKSPAESRVKVWRFTNFSRTDSVPIFRELLMDLWKPSFSKPSESLSPSPSSGSCWWICENQVLRSHRSHWLRPHLQGVADGFVEIQVLRSHRSHWLRRHLQGVADGFVKTKFYEAIGVTDSVPIFRELLMDLWKSSFTKPSESLPDTVEKLLPWRGRLSIGYFIEILVFRKENYPLGVFLRPSSSTIILIYEARTFEG